MMTENELGADNIRDTHWLGEVADNKDPLNNGRCRVRVFGKFDTIPTSSIPWASPSNMMTPGQHTVPRIGDIVSITFDNGNIYFPTYSYQINQNSSLKQDVLNDSSEPHNVISLIYDALRNFRFYMSKEDGLIITSGQDKTSAPMIRFHDGKIFLNSDNIFIASNWSDESEPAVKGETLRKMLDRFMQSVITHKHLTPNGSPTSAPIPPEVIDIQVDKSKLETIKQFKVSVNVNDKSIEGTNTGQNTVADNNSQNITTSTTGSVSSKTDSTPVVDKKAVKESSNSSNSETSTYSTVDEMILDPNGKPIAYTGITTNKSEETNLFYDKFNGNDITASSYNGKPSNKQVTSIFKAVASAHNNGGGSGLCARWTYNIAKKYTYLLNNKPIPKFSTGHGNANGLYYFQSLESLGYRKISGGSNLDKTQLISALNRDYDIGDVVCYWASNGPAETNWRKYGHTQIFTGGLPHNSRGHKWSSDNFTNFNTYFVYNKVKSSIKWNLVIFKAPVA